MFSKTSMLAKMMSNEDITVVVKKTETASFDIKNRVLTLPSFVKSVSDNVRMAFVSHEVGHALYTPFSDGMKITSSLNILEDVRIERLMNRTYLGSNRFMRLAYAELFADNFFCVDETSINTKGFYNRLNIHTKLARCSIENLNIQFSDEEMVFVDKSFKTVTYEDVVALEKEIAEFLKEKNESDTEQYKQDDESNEDGEFGEDEKESGSNDSSVDDSDEKENAEESEEDDSTESDYESDSEEDDPDEQLKKDMDSSTQKSFDDSISDISDTPSPYTHDIILKDYSDDKIISNSVFVSGINKMFCKYVIAHSCSKIDRRVYSNKEFGDSYCKTKLDSLKPQVNALVQQFNSKKSAEEYALATISETGELDAELLSEYKFSDDLFLRSANLGIGSNHGLVLSIDFSGSMLNSIQSVCTQAITLALFAKKANIPFKVVGFTTMTPESELRCLFGPTHEEPENGDILMNSVFCFDLVNSDLNKKEFDAAIKLMLCVSPWFAYLRGATPLNENILLLTSIVARWKKAKGIEKVNTVVLTDGSGSTVNYMEKDQERERNYINKYDTYDITDIPRRKTIHSLNIKDVYARYKEMTGSNLCLIFLGMNNSIRYHLKDYKYCIPKSGFDVITNKLHPDIELCEVATKYMVMTNKDMIERAENIKVSSGSAARKSFMSKRRAKATSTLFVSEFMKAMA
ncbi:MAG: hypothetical protein R8M45_04545 [Ghiorsea sp.]